MTKTLFYKNRKISKGPKISSSPSLGQYDEDSSSALGKYSDYSQNYKQSICEAGVKRKLSVPETLTPNHEKFITVRNFLTLTLILGQKH